MVRIVSPLPFNSCIMAHKEDEDSFEEYAYINPEDGMPNVHPNIVDLQRENEARVEADDFEDLPKSIIVTNIRSDIFADEKLKREMEDLFKTFSDDATFQWLRSFRRLRVNYDSAVAAANARVQLHQYEFYESRINCYFAQPVTPVSLRNLRPPTPTKQFLISPPSSPPVGWEPREESEPTISQELLAALATLAPGESHELHARTPTQPAIVVHTALAEPSHTGRTIPHTRCPDY